MPDPIVGDNVKLKGESIGAVTPVMTVSLFADPVVTCDYFDATLIKKQETFDKAQLDIVTAV